MESFDGSSFPGTTETSVSIGTTSERKWDNPHHLWLLSITYCARRGCCRWMEKLNEQSAGKWSSTMVFGVSQLLNTPKKCKQVTNHIFR